MTLNFYGKSQFENLSIAVDYSNLLAPRGQSKGEGVRTSPRKGGGVGDAAFNFYLQI